VKDNPAETTISLLTSIWQRLLQRSPIGVDKLCSEIAGVLSRDLAPVAVCRAPAIASLAALLDERPAPLVLLKAGREQPPVFVAPGLGGNALDLAQLAGSITTQHPIYGIHAKGLDGVDEPLERFEDMALFYTDAIRRLQPHGPYALVGYSTGGLAVLEIARGLSDAGEKIALLVLLDAYSHRRNLPFGQGMRLIARRISGHVSEMSRLSVHDALFYFIERVQRRLHLSRGLAGTAPQEQPISPSFSNMALQVRHKTYLAFKRYRPRFYGGKVKFVSSSRNPHVPDDPLAVWGRFTAELEIEHVAGDHLTMMSAHVESVALIVSRFLTDAFR
jgi:acetoacetyl-CoA synthetase